MGLFKKKKHVKSSLSEKQAYDLMVKTVKLLMNNYLDKELCNTLKLNVKNIVDIDDEEVDDVIGITFNPYNAAINHNKKALPNDKIPVRDLVYEYDMQLSKLIKAVNEVTNKQYIFVKIYEDGDWDDAYKIYAETEGYIKEEVSINDYLLAIDALNE